MSNIFVSKHPLVSHKLSLLRCKTQNSKQVRELIDEIGTLLIYEATADLPLVSQGKKESPLSAYEAVGISDRVALIPILRSGLGLVDAGLRAIPTASILHLGLYRDKASLQAVEYYNKLPATPNVPLCIVLDPMIATGGTARATIAILSDWGAKNIKFVCVCASKQGLQALSQEYPHVQIYAGVIDDEMDSHGYIIPGIGDAGDRLYKSGQPY